MKSLTVAETKNLPRFVTQQIHYTLEAREAEYELLPISVEEGLGVMVWSPLAGGLLSGMLGRDTMPADSRWAKGWSEPPIRDWDRLWRIVDVLKEIAAERGVTAAQVNLAWTLSRPAVSSLVVGGVQESQFLDNFAAVDLRLEAPDLHRLNAVSLPPCLYPYWHQHNFARERLSTGDHALLDAYKHIGKM